MVGKVDHTNTVCCVCWGKSRLKFIDFEGKPVFHWNREYNNKNKWTGRYKCDNCVHKHAKDINSIVVDKEGTIGWLKEKLEEKSINTKDINFGGLIILAQENKILKSWTDIHREKRQITINNTGCRNETEYQNKNKQKLGFEDFNEYQNLRSWERGKSEPLEFNEDCSANFGIEKGEMIFRKYLESIFECVKHMKYNNQGFDFICSDPIQEFIDRYPALSLERDKEYRFQLKVRNIREKRGWIGWDYPIRHNKNCDYYILCSFKNRKNLEPSHIHIVPTKDIVRGIEFWRRTSFTITNNPNYLRQLMKYDLVDDLDRLNEICKEVLEND